jgi:hypothetical protein
VDQTLIQEILEIVEQAAIASASLSGKGLKDEADALAVDAMRKRMNQIQMQGRIVIGEGNVMKPRCSTSEKRSAPALALAWISLSTLAKAPTFAPSTSAARWLFSPLPIAVVCSTPPTST